MKLANSIKISVFSKDGEDAQAIEKKLKQLIPFNLIDEKIAVQRQTAIGFNEKKIMLLEINLKRQRHTTAFLENLNNKLGQQQKDMLLRQKESRLDNDLNFFIRLDKEKLLNDEYWITDSGNCYHIKISIAAFPKRREYAIQIIEHIYIL